MSVICDIGAAKLDPETGAIVVQVKGAVVSADGTSEDFGSVPIMCALGLLAFPYPATEEGSAECLVDNDAAGFDGIATAARDIRTSSIAGKLAPGDVCLHSTGPKQAAMLLLKEEKKQVVLRTVDEQGKDMVLMLDGKNEKGTIAAFGYVIEISREHGITIGDSGAMIQIKDGQGSLTGNWTFGGRFPLGNLLYSVGGVPVVGVSGVGTPAPGLFVGA